jgi:hypothetical protein
MMIRLRRSYSDFKSLVASKSLQIIYGDVKADSYQLLALDGQVTYETIIPKDGGADQLDFESSIMPGITARISTEPDWDDMITTFPAANQDLHTYKRNSVTVQTVLVTYSNPGKTVITRIQKTRV